MKKNKGPLTMLNRYGLDILNRHYGILQGIVLDNSDPELTGKITVGINQSTFSDFIEMEAYPLMFGGGQGFGFRPPLPSVGNLVNLLFMEGNLAMPYWTYAGWGEGEAPIDFRDKNSYGLVTPLGNSIVVRRNQDGTESLDIKFTGSINISSDTAINIKSPMNYLDTGDDGFNCLGNDGNGGWAIAEKLATRLNILVEEINSLKQELALHTHTSPTSGGPTSPPVAPLTTNISEFQGVTFVDMNNLS